MRLSCSKFIIERTSVLHNRTHQAWLLRTIFLLSIIIGCVGLVVIVLIRFGFVGDSFAITNAALFRSTTNNSVEAPSQTNDFWQGVNFALSISQDIQLEGDSNDYDRQPENKIKIVLHWNNWDPYMGNQPLIDSLCPVTACIFTPDRSFLNHSDVVLFSFDNDTISTMNPLPTHRKEHQRFVFVASQPPDVAAGFFDRDRNDWSRYFNWTMTYRLDSDIVFRQALGTFTPLPVRHMTSNGHKLLRSSPPSFNWMTRPSRRLRIVSRIGDKKKLIAWFPSQCTTSVRREEYVRMLSQYVPVDIFGKCGNLTCSMDCFDMLRYEYKFYLAFEESWCSDYVTNEFYKALDSDTVPVVLGGADYDSIGPPNSLINVLDFPSIKSLADYLLFLDKTPEMYARYFDWKRNFQIAPKPMSGWCDLCRFAHDPSLPAKVYRSISKWWVDDGLCQHKIALQAA